MNKLNINVGKNRVLNSALIRLKCYSNIFVKILALNKFIVYLKNSIIDLYFRKKLKRNFVSDFLKENGLGVNLLLLLGFVLLVIVTVDLNTDLSVEKKEIECVFCTITPNIPHLDLNLQRVKDFVVPCVGIILMEDDTITNRICYSPDFGRAPPRSA